MIAFWYGILAFMITTYVVLDGRNFGVGILHWFVARNRGERRQVVAAIGPLFLSHEVWLVATGGVIIVAFPRLMAIGFPGYYLALFLILWCVVLRGVAIEVGGHIDDRLWQSFWDAVFVFSSVLLAVLFGAALGNVVRGVPLTQEGAFHLAFFTNVFRTSGEVGLLDWYTVSMALFCVLVLTAHGATYLTLKTEGAVQRRAARLGRVLWLVAIPAFVLIGLLTWRLRPELVAGLLVRPLAWLPCVVCAVSGWALVTGWRKNREWRAFLGSSFLLFGLLMTGAAVLFPVLLLSTLRPVDQLTAFTCAAPAHSLRIAAGWWSVALALAFTYLFLVHRHYIGKVNVSKDDQGIS